jgi:hypothetical protein
MATPTTSPLPPQRPPEETAEPCSVGRAPSRAAAWLEAVTDPEWLLVFGVLLVPAAVALVLGGVQRASFFLGVAVYVAVLKWLGWVVFGRWTTIQSRFLLFPAELFAGLAVVCAWFYLRNLGAKVWPPSYGLGELAWLFPILLALHAAALLSRLRRSKGALNYKQLGERLALYAPFAAVLAVALWSISTVLGVQGTDAMTYTFLARIYRSEGIDFAVPPANLRIVYPSALGAMNATAAALAPLSVLQAFHLQHVLLYVAALFLITATVAVLAGRPLPLLHSLPLPFLFAFPLYALYPDVLYPGTPKQAGPPLFVAICLLPLLASVARRSAFFLAAGVVGFLAMMACALNPACVPYALVALAVAVVIFTVRGRSHLGLARWKTVAALAGLSLAAAGTIGSCDLYYRSLLRPYLTRDAAPAPRPKATVTARPPLFSWKDAARGLAAVNPVTLSPLETTTRLVWEPADHLKGWDRRSPPWVLAGGALALTLLALAGLLSQRSRAASRRDPLVRLLLVGLLLWLGLKYALTFCSDGLSRENHMTALLAIYLRYLLFRCELLLLFACLVAAGVRLSEALKGRARRIAAVAAGVACWLLPALGLAAGVTVSGFAMIPTTDRFEVREDDRKMAAWVSDNVPPEKGAIGLAAFTFTAGRHDEEHHLYPSGSGHALPLYGRHYNFRFFLSSLERDGAAAYQKHVSDDLPLPLFTTSAVGLMGSPLGPGPLLVAFRVLPRRPHDFDADWCLKNDIRYFYATPKGLAENPSLVWAIARGRLRLLHQEGDSCLYEVVGGAQ